VNRFASTHLDLLLPCSLLVQIRALLVIVVLKTTAELEHHRAISLFFPEQRRGAQPRSIP